MSPATAVVLGYIWGAASILIAVSFGRARRDERILEDVRAWEQRHEEHPVHHYVSRN